MKKDPRRRRRKALRPPTGSAGYIRGVLQTIEARGGDPNLAARNAGIDLRVLSNPAARVSFNGVRELWLQASVVSGDPTVGLYFPDNLAPGALDGLLTAFLTSSTVLEAVRRMIRYQYLVSDIASIELEHHRDCYRIVFTHPHDADPPPCVADAITSAVVTLARSMFPARPFNPSAVQLMRPRPADVGPWNERFRAPITYGAEADVIEYTAEAMLAAVPEHNVALARASDAVVSAALAAFRHGRITDRAYDAIVTSLPSGGIGEEQVARRLAMSRATLLRGLQKEGTTFRGLLAKTRQDLARGYLEEGGRSVKEIAFLVGFADASSFSRAFRRWSSMSPSDYAARRGRHS